MSFRICMTRIPSLTEVVDGQISGLFGPVYSLISDDFRRRGNITLTEFDKLGDWNEASQMFDGCLGQLQKNESDIHMPMVTYPVVAAGLDQGFLGVPFTIVITAAYTVNSNLDHTDVMDAFVSLSPAIWYTSALLSTMIALVIVLVMRLTKSTNTARRRKTVRRAKTRRAIKQATKIAIGNMLKQHPSYSWNTTFHTARAALLLFALLTFFVGYFFCAMIKTDMVVIKKPVTISTYEEILEQKVRPVWAKQLTDHTEFMNADPGSLEDRIWKLAESYGIENCRLDADLTSATTVAIEISNQKAVFFISSYLVSLARTNVCAMARQSGYRMSTNSYMYSDPSAREKIATFMISSHSEDYVKRIHRELLGSVFEHALLLQSIKRLDYVISKDTGSRELRDCVSNTIIYPDHEIIFPDADHYQHLFALSGVLLFVAAFVYACELLSSTRHCLLHIGL